MINAERATAAPITVNSSVRKYLTEREVERLMAAARKSGRYGHRDATMILLAFRHGLRASELCDLLWSQVELAAGRLHVRRAKSGTPSVHPLQGDELRALRRLQREQQPSSHVFTTERGGPMTCYATPAATPWPMLATTLARCRHTSVIGTSSTLCAIPIWHHTGSRTSGANPSRYGPPPLWYGLSPRPGVPVNPDPPDKGLSIASLGRYMIAHRFSLEHPNG
jgi:Phage integrase family